MDDMRGAGEPDMDSWAGEKYPKLTREEIVQYERFAVQMEPEELIFVGGYLIRPSKIDDIKKL